MIHLTRRSLIVGSAASLIMARRAFAAGLPLTPAQTEGPFYPDILPTDTDADLVRIASMMQEAGGEILQLSGRVLDVAGRPVDAAVVEIWQCDENGRYLHSGDRADGERDPYFQGFGRALADSDGLYRFRTIRPVPYPGRTPHIHFKIYRREGPVLTTQMYVADEAARNARDGLYRRLAPEQQRLVTADLHRVGGGQWEAQFDLVVGG